MIRVAINGYGRIGRVAHRVIVEKYQDKVKVVAINAGSSTDIQGWMYLLKYDSVYGKINNHSVTFKNPQDKQIEFKTNSPIIGYLTIDEEDIPVFSEKDPSVLPWEQADIDVVIESTGHFTKEEQLSVHLKAGAKAVVLSAPIKGEDSVPTYILGVNLEATERIEEKIISNGSCTTNCIAPVAKIIEEAFGIEKAMMTTIHAYTSDQKLHDGGHKDYRRERAAGINIIPTSTGATQAAAKALPSLSGKFSGLSLRVPVPVGSLSDFTFLLKKEVTVEDINKTLEEASKKPQYQGILKVTNDPIVSSDIIGDPYSSIVDLSLTQVTGGNMVKVIAWYDNEFGYANRLIEETIQLGESL